MPSLPISNNAAEEDVTPMSIEDEASMKANEKYLHDFFVRHQKTILENTIQEYRVMFIYDNIPLLLGYVCLFVLGIVANGVQIYATILQIRRRENTVCSKMFLQLAISQTLLIIYLIPMDYLWRYSQVWEAGERACQLLVWIRFYLIVTVAAFTVLQTFVRYRVMKASVEVVNSQNNGPDSTSLLQLQTTDQNKVEKEGNFRNRNRSANNTSTSNDANTADLEASSIQKERKSKLFFLRSWLKSIGNAIADILWPTRRLLTNSMTSTSSSSPPSAVKSVTTPDSPDWRRTGAKKPRNFNENRLIVLGWLLPLILCAPEAAVYKLHVHKDIGGYQQCADIFVKQEELLFPRLFPSAAVEDGEINGDKHSEKSDFLLNDNDTNEESSTIATLIYDINSGSGDVHQNSNSLLTASLSTFEMPTIVDQTDFTTTLLAGDIDLASINQPDTVMTPVQIVYYLLLQSLTFVIPVGAILVINALVVKCYWQIRRRNNAVEQPNSSNEAGTSNHQSGEENNVVTAKPPTGREKPKTTDPSKDPLLLRKEQQFRELRNWAAHRTLFLTLSFGVSYIVCWFPMAMLMATRWNALFIKAPPPETTLTPSSIGDFETAESYIEGPLDTDMMGQDYSTLGFWAFIEEWAIAWGLMIGVINPLLYGLFHLLGGNHKKLYDWQFCAGLVKTGSSQRSTSADKDSSNSGNSAHNKAHLQQLFSSSRQSTSQDQTNYRGQPFKKIGTPSRNIASRYGHYNGQTRISSSRTVRTNSNGDQCQISRRKTKQNSGSNRGNRSLNEVMALNPSESSTSSMTVTTLDEK